MVRPAKYYQGTGKRPAHVSDILQPCRRSESIGRNPALCRTFGERAYIWIAQLFMLLATQRKRPSVFIACSFIEYYILFISIYTILSHSGYGLKSVVFGVIISTFFTQFFVLSIHLLRQVMAFSIVFYAISRKAVDGKNHWLPLICAPLIHSTAALFSILSLLPWIFHRMNLRQWIYFILILMSLISSCIAIGSTLTNLLGEDNGSSYIFRRMSDGYDDGGTMDIVKSLIIIIPLLDNMRHSAYKTLVRQ